MAQKLEEPSPQSGCATDCGLKSSCTSSEGCSSKPKFTSWLFLFVTSFVIAVWALANFGGPLLEGMGRDEKTIGILDMARQSVQTRDYATAEQLFKQAICDAEVSGGDRLAYALASYAEFLRKRKRISEAVPLERRAKEIQGIVPAGAKS
jgi:hypothetical protein